MSAENIVRGIGGSTRNGNGASSSRTSVGEPIDRIDGKLKVTGGAKYAAEYPVADIVHAVMITSTIANGRVTNMDTRAALKAPGVIAVITPENAPRLPGAQPQASSQQSQSSGQASSGGRGGAPGGAPSGGGMPPMRVPTLLQDDTVHYNGQPIGVVVADTLDHALAAVEMVKVAYAEEKPSLDMSSAPKVSPEQVRPLGGARSYKRGDVDGAMASAPVKLDHTYSTPLENHNAMETHSTIASWEGDRVTVYDSTQGIFSVRNTIAKTFGLPNDNVRVVSYFTGGGFGSKGGAWSHEMLATMASKVVGKPVKLVLTRRQMFGPVGGRPRTIQHIQIGAASDGAMTAMRHTSLSNTSTLENWIEPALSQTRMLYAVPNLETVYDLVKLNVGSPTFQRAPGESTGTFALESAMDELSYALGMDPIDVRLKNYAETDPESGHPWSSKSLRECYKLGAEKFGWSKRNPKPRSMRDGNWLVGYGLGTATYPARRQAAGTERRGSIPMARSPCARARRKTAAERTR